MTDDKSDGDRLEPPLHQMTEAEQLRQQTGPGTEGRPGFVIVKPTIPRPYYRDEKGRWRQVGDADSEGKER